jgi:small subunit ribosomal protein MRP21
MKFNLKLGVDLCRWKLQCRSSVRFYYCNCRAPADKVLRIGQISSSDHVSNDIEPVFTYHTADTHSRATELGRVAHAALRSAHSFRSSTSKIPSRSYSLISIASSCSRAPSTASILLSLRTLSINGTSTQQNRHQTSWASPGRSPRQSSASKDVNIVKPTTPTPSTSLSDLDIPDPETDAPQPRGVFGPEEDDFDFSKGYNFAKGELSNTRLSNYAEWSPIKYPEIRCVPRTGRTIHVSKGADVARSIKLLNMQCAANRVRQDVQTQRFHERPGLKRKRLKSERWQRRFKKGFKATCKRVDELRRQGW